MTDEQTKRSDRIKYAIAAGAVAAGAIGNRIVDSCMQEPVIEYMPPPPATAPEEPEQKNDNRPRMRIPTPLDTVNDPKWVKYNNQEKGRIA